MRVSGGRAAAMGGTAVCERSVWALRNNPAGLALLRGWHGGLYYENQWLLKETAFKSGAVAKDVSGIGCFGLLVCQFGWSQFSDNQFGVAYARDFGPYLQMGLRADWVWLHLGEAYPDQNRLGVELGIQSQATEKLLLGASLYNIERIKFGLAYRFTEDFVGQLEVEKDSQRAGVRLGAGLEYVLFDRFSLRAGAQHNPNIICFGVGYLLRHIQVDVAAQMHQALGASLQIGVTYENH